ncbi:hypothetical protein SAMN05660484_02478 [Eubacterium ruminantium]|uniref:hypothetical protein n=1 Tax=Eubacterium ruminantium TaxID=42322 RepID=UPI0008714B2C|nr:hypothetical protein [Eubacterium ruminantium]SCW67946.1 hypothetical protein SAMN05660484_02478 [Eubacterium ruminantium]SDN39977.1 hypothetical protein SAMN04490370_1215 [Eubacterium ruminantium]
MTIWMYVTLDEYELPVAVADTAAELAKMIGCTANNIYSAYTHYKKGRHKRSRVVKVEVEDD